MTNKTAKEATKLANKIIFSRPRKNSTSWDINNSLIDEIHGLNFDIDEKTQKILPRLALVQWHHGLSDEVKQALKTEGPKYGIKCEMGSGTDNQFILHISLADYNQLIAPVLAKGRGRTE